MFAATFAIDIGVSGPLSPSEEEPQSSSNTVPIIAGGATQYFSSVMYVLGCDVFSAGAIVGGVLLIAGTALLIIFGLVYVRRTHRKAVEETGDTETLLQALLIALIW